MTDGPSPVARPPTPVFQKVRGQRAFEEVAEQIQQAIVHGHYGPGDRLPPERALTELFQVSRGSLREALRVLERSGVLTIKPGAAGGAFVRELSLDHIAGTLTMLLQLGTVGVAEIADFRKLLEGGAAYRAALHAGEEDIAGMEAAATTFKALLDHPDTTPTEFVAQDMLFHRAVLKGSRNRLIVAVLNAIRESLETPLQYIPAGHQHRMYADMTGIIAAVRARQPEEAQRIMEAHIGDFNTLILKNIGA